MYPLQLATTFPLLQPASLLSSQAQDSASHAMLHMLFLAVQVSAASLPVCISLTAESCDQLVFAIRGILGTLSGLGM